LPRCCASCSLSVFLCFISLYFLVRLLWFVVVCSTVVSLPASAFSFFPSV
jgi:hypothetical protein